MSNLFPKLQQYLPAIAQSSGIVFAIALTAAGLGSFAAPGATAQGFGLPDPQANSNLWIPLCGARNLGFGLAGLVFVYQRNFKALGTLLLCGVTVGTTDATITWRHGLRAEAWRHGIGTLLLGLIGGYLAFVE